jgi:tRNA (guanine37-N1)-methyltransferase
MRVDIFTIFPGMFDGFLNESILRRAQEDGLLEIQTHDIRDWSTDKHRSVDDYPYGGGAGMVMMAPPIVTAVEDVLADDIDRTEIIALSASGEQFVQSTACELSRAERLALICGRYEGIDQRAIDILRAREISIGDFVLTGGELAAAVIVDAVARLVPGVIQSESAAEDSYAEGLLEYPHYTRPYEFRGLTPPDVLLSGHHARIGTWRRQQALCRTRARRPDLLDHSKLSAADLAALEHCEDESTTRSRRSSPIGDDTSRD